MKYLSSTIYYLLTLCCCLCFSSHVYGSALGGNQMSEVAGSIDRPHKPNSKGLYGDGNTSTTGGHNQRLRKNLLGGGGTNYSRRKQGRDGLLTQTNSAMHLLFGAYAEGLYSQQFLDYEEMANSPIGYAYGGGLLLELQLWKYVNIQSGVGVRKQTLKNKVPNFSLVDDNVVDAMGYPYHLYYDFYNRRDVGDYLHVQVPILIGHTWSKFYFLLGCKLNWTIKANSNITAIGSTTAKYDNFLGTFVEMDNHGLRKDVPIASRMDMLPEKGDYWFDVLGSIECGVEFASGRLGSSRHPWVSKSRKWRFTYRSRIAAICDVGLSDLAPRTANSMVEIPVDYKWDFTTFKMHNVIMLNKITALHNFYAGIKISVFFDFYDDSECRLCGDYQTEIDMGGY